MEERQFDGLTRMLGQATSRRQVLRGLAVGVIGAVFGAKLGRPEGAAADICPYRVPNPSHTPTYNGCGSDYSSYVVPDKYKKATFTQACNNHDICYDTCNRTKAECDFAFLDDLKAACRAAYPAQKDPRHPDSKQYLDCVDRAYAYYTAVDQYAGGAYDAAQAEACICCQQPACGNACCDDLCSECVNGICQPKSCGLCATCNPATGVCQSTCESGQTCCVDSCVDLQSDPNNCGACLNACDAGQPCNDGVCGCPPGRTMCDGQCVDLTSDPQHCGTCDTVCGAQQMCSSGQCQSCTNGHTICGGQCVSTTCQKYEQFDTYSCQCIAMCPVDQTWCYNADLSHSCCTGYCIPPSPAYWHGCCPSDQVIFGSTGQAMCCGTIAIDNQTQCCPSGCFSNGQCCSTCTWKTGAGYTC